MRKAILVSVAAFVLILAVSSGIGYAGCGWGHGSKSADKGEVINTHCPVMGGEISKDTAYKTEYKGKTVGFCCAACVDKFKENPKKYMEKLKTN